MHQTHATCVYPAIITAARAAPDLGDVSLQRGGNRAHYVVVNERQCYDGQGVGHRRPVGNGQLLGPQVGGGQAHQALQARQGRGQRGWQLMYRLCCCCSSAGFGVAAMQAMPAQQAMQGPLGLAQARCPAPPAAPGRRRRWRPPAPSLRRPGFWYGLQATGRQQGGLDGRQPKARLHARDACEDSRGRGGPALACEAQAAKQRHKRRVGCPARQPAQLLHRLPRLGNVCAAGQVQVGWGMRGAAAVRQQ